MSSWSETQHVITLKTEWSSSPVRTGIPLLHILRSLYPCSKNQLQQFLQYIFAAGNVVIGGFWAYYFCPRVYDIISINIVYNIVYVCLPLHVCQFKRSTIETIARGNGVQCGLYVRRRCCEWITYWCSALAFGVITWGWVECKHLYKKSCLHHSPISTVSNMPSVILSKPVLRSTS